MLENGQESEEDVPRCGIFRFDTNADLSSIVGTPVCDNGFLVFDFICALEVRSDGLELVVISVLFRFMPAYVVYMKS